MECRRVLFRSPDTATLTLLADLIVSAEDIRLRVADSEFSHVVQVCDRLLAQARPLAELDVDFTLSASWVKSLDLIKSLADALLALFNPERDTSALAGEVAAAVDRFRSRRVAQQAGELRSEEHTSELQSLMRNSYAVFCWTK